MTDTWSQTVERAIAPEPAAEPAPAPAPGPSVEPPSWQPYAAPSEPPPAAVAHADPLILELEHDAQVAAPAPAEPAPSVYGRVEPDLEPMQLTSLEIAPPEPVAAEPPVASAPVVATPSAEAPMAEPLVAQVEKPVEMVAQPAEPVAAPAPAVVEPLPIAPVVAAPALAMEPPPPARSVMAEAPFLHAAEASHGIDPVLAGFDHVVALAGYVLLFLSVFMFGVPALATVALAYAHKNDSHLLVRSHYRFQLRVFWTAILFGVLALGAAVTAGGLAVSKLVDFIHAHLPGVDAVMDRANVGAWSGEIAGVLLIAAVTLALLAVVWTLVASVFGFLRLLGNRPIGHQFVGK